MAVRIVSATVQYLLSETNAEGELIAEYLSQPVRVFRAVHQDIWTHGDTQAFPADAPKDPSGYVLGELPKAASAV